MTVHELAPDVRAVSALRRLDELFDPATLADVVAEPDSGVVRGTGRVGGIPTVAFASEAATRGGALGAAACRQIVAAYHRAGRIGAPIVGIWHSGGARLDEGVDALEGVGAVLAAMTAASGRIPQISLVLGPAAGGAAYGPALTDFVVLGPRGRVFITGPDVVRSVTGEDVDMHTLGGPEAHGRRSGLAHVTCDSNSGAYDAARRLVELTMRPGAWGEVDDRPFAELVPESPRRAYDMRPLVTQLLDEPGLELSPRWAPNVLTVLGRVGGHAVGVVASNPIRLAGCLDAAAADKAARFVRMCDAFGIPLAVLVDVPGYLPGVSQEWGGVVRRGAKLIHAFAGAVVPRVTLVLRKAYGGAYIAMNSKALGADRVLAWPGAQLAVMGAEAAVGVLHRRELAAVLPLQRAALERSLATEFTARSRGLAHALATGVVDEIVPPERTRSALAAALAERGDARGRRDNIPL